MRTELEIQQWLEATIAADNFVAAIEGRSQIEAVLKAWRSPDYWPQLPIDYLTRLRVVETANEMIDELHGLEQVSSSSRSISRTKGEALFVDLLYARPDGSKFVAIEVKKDRATAREAITELLAYEHEIQNHIPFESSRDVLLVIVARDFPALLDHAVCGLVTWGRRRILCLKFEDSAGNPRLSIHTPASWAAVGQTVLPASGLQLAHLSLRPNQPLSSEATLALFETAAQLMTREAERSGSSGFVFVAKHIFFPAGSQSEYVLIAGALNPFCFLPHAEKIQFADGSDSPLSAYLLDESHREDLPISWDWMGNDGDAAATFLRQFGSVSWENTSSWDLFRASYRWNSQGVTADRYLFPVTADAWGVLGDYMRDVVKQWGRLKNFSPGYCKPGIDWRYPWLAVQLLDDLALPHVVEAGEWTFGALFELGRRLGRHAAYAAQYADAEAEEAWKIRPTLFWAEADLSRLMDEIRMRYVGAVNLRVDPPRFKIGDYESSDQVGQQTAAFANWVSKEFIGANEPFLQEAFATGLQVYGLHDAMFHGGKDDALSTVQAFAVSRARDWLSQTVEAVFGGEMSEWSLGRVRATAATAFGDHLPLSGTKDVALEALGKLSDALLIERLSDAIPAMVDRWCPQLGHVLAPIGTVLPDWDWFERQIREHRGRGVQNPCILVTPDGQFGIGVIPPGSMGVPAITDPKAEVLVLLNQSLVRLVLRTTWVELRAGKIPGVRDQ